MRLAELLYTNPLYRIFLAGPTPRRLTCLPPPAWLGNRAKGAAILGGTLRCAGRPVRINPPDWRSVDLTADALGELHGFRWLDDLAATGSNRAIEMARGLIESWIDEQSDWSSIAWAPHVLGNRIATWLTHARLIAREGDPLGPRILASLARQMRHLVRVAGTAPEGVERLMAIRGLVYGAASGIGPAGRLAKVRRQLSGELARQVLADGGHVARAPAEHIQALTLLIDIREMLAIAQCALPDDLVLAIDRMAPIAHFYRYRDGRLALFNGTAEGDSALIDTVLRRTNAGVSAPESARHAHFERISAEQTLIFMDTGTPPPKGFDGRAHAGTLSFEMSHGRERLIVNCGAFTTADPAWQAAQRATIAHSTVTIDDTNSSEIREDGSLGRIPNDVKSVRESLDGSVLITASHDGYLSNFGVLHHRRLYVTGDGNDIRGEDILTGNHQGQFSLRFHLHPDVRASIVQNGVAVLMRLPSGIAWRLQASNRLELTESVYLGCEDRRRAEQVVISGRLHGHEARVKWAIKRIPAA